MLIRVVPAAMTGPSISVLHNRTLVITHESLMLMGGFPLLGDSGTCPLSISWFCFPLGLQSPLHMVGRQEREHEEGTDDAHTTSQTGHLTLSGDKVGRNMWSLAGWLPQRDTTPWRRSLGFGGQLAISSP